MVEVVRPPERGPICGPCQSKVGLEWIEFKRIVSSLFPEFVGFPEVCKEVARIVPDGLSYAPVTNRNPDAI
jgi:hypothetical protein